MLGRKQSLKGEHILADYGPEESFNESADIEWVNKVRNYFFKDSYKPDVIHLVFTFNHRKLTILLSQYKIQNFYVY